jgi:hypothetical protein
VFCSRRHMEPARVANCAAARFVMQDHGKRNCDAMNHSRGQNVTSQFRAS